MMLWIQTDPRVDLGFLPHLIDDADPRSVREQLETNYAHGGGWNPMDGFKIVNEKTMAIKFPGDPPMRPLALSACRDERLFFYPHAFLMIMQPDGKYEVARVD